MSDRYQKQELFAPIGKAGQQAIGRVSVLLVGCGAIGSAIADSLTRAGIGLIKIVDRDYVDLGNLQRQTLFDEDDVKQLRPKAIAAATRLQKINSEVQVLPIVADVTAANIRELLKGIDLILDGTDNFETRFLLNDASLEYQIPWVSGGVLGASGQVQLIVPGKSACLRCLVSEPPPQTETCDTAGVLGPAVQMIAALQVVRALQWICRNDHWTPPPLTVIDAWEQRFRTIDLQPLKRAADCPACDRGERLWLSGQQGSYSQILCGRNAVQISPAQKLGCSLAEIETRWQSLGVCQLNPFLLWFCPHAHPELEMHLFADGRAIIKGTEDIACAKACYTRYLGM